MGVYRTDYIVYGWKLPFRAKDVNGKLLDFYSDSLIRMVEGHKSEKYRLIPDFMSGNYTVFGIVKQQGDDWNFDKISLDNLHDDMKELKLKYKEIVGEEPAENPTLFIFSHYS